MSFLKFTIVFICGILYCTSVFSLDHERKPYTVLVTIFARNKAHALPYFLTLFSSINYPKDRLSLYVRSDHNEDRTIEILKDWLNMNQKKYHSVDIFLDESSHGYLGEGSILNWNEDRFDHIIKLKDAALEKAKAIWADYVWFLDVDVFILEPNILFDLINLNKPIIAPMLNSLATYSNYWCGMSTYWYIRTEDYLPILEYKKKGCFNVPMIHSSILIDNMYVNSDKLTFNSSKIGKYDGPKDDIIAFAIGAKQTGLDMFICNHKRFGFIPPPLDAEDHISKEYQHITELKLESLVNFPPWPVSEELVKYKQELPLKTKLDFDNVYMINLKRRPDRLQRMLQSFDELGINAEVFEAFDGKNITSSFLNEHGIKQLEGYKDPWWKRDMKYGEIGCFLSHYFIWEDVVKNNYQKVLLFEDDIRFEPLFKYKLSTLMSALNDLQLSWDLIYLGRKILKNSNETWVDGTDLIVNVDYSHWTLCYMLTLDGAKKLLKPQPLKKMVPVDEYLPIMFNRHPEESWKQEYYPRNLKAYSANPLLVFPTHYTGQEGYISDTESSPVIDEEVLVNDDLPKGPPSIISKRHFSNEGSFSGLNGNEL